jgi:hypothetical protein
MEVSQLYKEGQVMWKRVSGCVAAALCSSLAFADSQIKSGDTAFRADGAAEVAKAIEQAEWSFSRSSLAPVIEIGVMDKSRGFLERSRQELAQGNVRTARELVDRAMEPLAQMRSGAMAGKHPDQHQYKEGLRQTLLSLLPEAQRIAREKRVSDAFVADARAAVERSDALLAEGQAETARQTLMTVYETVQQRLAGLRSGDDFYLAIPQLPESEQWSDGLRRIEERRIISQYLLIEAKSSGLDVAALQSGIRGAEDTVADAEHLAAQSRWTPALERLELAYIQYEDSWRTAGVEW